MKISLEEALRRFLTGERARLPRRDFASVEDVLGTLRFSIGWYSDEKFSAVRASGIADHLSDFYYTVVHKKFASPSRLETISEVMQDLVGHLRDTGQIGAGTAESLAGEIAARLGGLADVRRFVEALRSHIENEAFEFEDEDLDEDDDLGDLDYEEEVTDEYVGIAQITATSITFTGYRSGDTVIGPITLPPHICAMAKLGWQILLSAARLDGRWFLRQVVNGDD